MRRGSVRVRRALPGDRAGIGAQDVEHDPHARRLAGAVRAEEAEDAAGLHAEAGVVEGDDVTEALRDGVDDEGHVARVQAAVGRSVVSLAEGGAKHG